MNLVLWGILGYVFLQLAVGVMVSRRIRSEDDYLLAGRSLGYGLAVFTIFATWFGAETCISAAGSIYESGLSGGSADPFGYGFCIVFLGAVFAVPLWKRKLTTLADLFRQRYSAGVERVAVLLMAPTSVLWAAAQIRAFGQVVDASSGLGVTTGITLAAVVVIVYTVFGGLRADVITDLIQGVMILVGLAVLAGAIWVSLEDPAGTVRSIPRERWNFFGGEGATWAGTLEAWMVPICGSVVAQELVARVMATRSARVARRATLLGGGMYLVVGLVPAGIGMIGFELMPGLEDPEQIIPLMAQRHLGTLLYILFAGALVSAILSTVDSTLLAASSLISHNLVVPLRPGMSEAAKVRMARIGVVVCGAAAYALALGADRIYDLVESASSFGSAGIFVILVMGLFSRWGGAPSALGALGAGVAVYVYGSYWGEWACPFLASLAAAAAGYLVLAGWGRGEQKPLPPSGGCGKQCHAV